MANLGRRISSFWCAICQPYYLYLAIKLQPIIYNRTLSNRALKLEELGLSDVDIAKIMSELDQYTSVELGQYDHYGKLIPAFSPIDGLTCCNKENARPRERAHVSLVAYS